MFKILAFLFFLGLMFAGNRKEYSTTEIPATTPDTLLTLNVSLLESVGSFYINETFNISDNAIGATEFIKYQISDTLKTFGENFHIFNSLKYSFNDQIADLSTFAVEENVQVFLENISVIDFGSKLYSGSGVYQFLDVREMKLNLPTNRQGIKLNGDISIIKNSSSSRGEFQLLFNEVNFLTTSTSIIDLRITFNMTYKNFDLQFDVPEDEEIYALTALNKLLNVFKEKIVTLMAEKYFARLDHDSGLTQYTLLVTCLEYSDNMPVLLPGYFEVQRNSSDLYNSSDSKYYSISVKGLNDFKTLHFTDDLENTKLVLLTNALEGQVDWYYKSENLTKHAILKFKSQQLRIEEKLKFDNDAHRVKVQQVNVDLAPVDVDILVEKEFVVLLKKIIETKIKNVIIEFVHHFLMNEQSFD